MEQLDLTTPIVPPATTYYQVVRLVLDWYGQYIEIGLRGPNGELQTHGYSGGTAKTLMTQLNTLDLSTTSLQKRILNRLIADGVVIGTVSGAPD